MKRSRLILLATLAVFGLIAFGTWLSLRASPSPINGENFDRLTIGMTLSDVEHILDGPPRDDSTGDLVALLSDAERGALAAASQDADSYARGLAAYRVYDDRTRQWISDSSVVYVQFEHGVLIDKQITHVYRSTPWQPFMRQLIGRRG